MWKLPQYFSGIPRMQSAPQGGCQERLGKYCEKKEFHPLRSTPDVMFAVRRLQRLGQKAGLPLFVCFFDIQNAYDSVDRNLLWQVLFRLGVPPQMITVIYEFR